MLSEKYVGKNSSISVGWVGDNLARHSPGTDSWHLLSHSVLKSFEKRWLWSKSFWTFVLPYSWQSMKRNQNYCGNVLSSNHSTKVISLFKIDKTCRQFIWTAVGKWRRAWGWKSKHSFLKAKEQKHQIHVSWPSQVSDSFTIRKNGGVDRHYHQWDTILRTLMVILLENLVTQKVSGNNFLE